MKKLICFFVVINVILLGAIIYLHYVGFEEKVDNDGSLVVSGLYNNPPKDFMFSMKGIGNVAVEKGSVSPSGRVEYKLKATGIVVRRRMSLWPLAFKHSGVYSQSELIHGLKARFSKLSPTAVIVEVIPPAGALDEGEDKISGLTRQ